MISFLPATEMFQFAGLPPPGVFGSARGDWALPQPGFPIRTSPDQRLLATPRSFTQPATSFIGSWRQGIHPVPFVACPLPASDQVARCKDGIDRDRILELTRRNRRSIYCRTTY